MTVDVTFRREPTQKPSSSASTRIVARGGTKRVKLRAREHARLRCHNLELDILNLHQEIATLETTRRLLFARTLNRADDQVLGSFLKIVREHHALTHAGYHDVVWRKVGKLKARTKPVDMVQFMRTCYDESMALGSEAPLAPGGLDTFVALLEHMMVVLDSPKVSLLSATVRTSEADSTAVVTVKTRCASFLTAVLLDSLFPHLSAWFPWLRAKLIGREMVTYGEGDFTFGTHHGRIVRVDLRIDQAASILKLAESLAELEILKGEHTPRSAAAIALVDDSDPDEARLVRCAFDGAKQDRFATHGTCPTVRPPAGLEMCSTTDPSRRRARRGRP